MSEKVYRLELTPLGFSRRTAYMFQNEVFPGKRTNRGAVNVS